MERKKYIIIFLILILFVMAIGLAYNSAYLKISGTSQISTRWDVRIIDVHEKDIEGYAESYKAPSWDDLNANMYASLHSKNDSISYDVEVKNSGDFDAKLNDVKLNTYTENPAIEVKITGYNKGEILKKNSSKIINVKIGIKKNYTGVIPKVNASFSISLEYVQNDSNVKTNANYLLTYDYETNGGDKSSKTFDYVKEDKNVKLDESSSKQGYKFVGWNTNQNAHKRQAKLKMPSSNETVYAIYSKKLNVNYEKDQNINQISKTNDTCTLYNDDKTCQIILPNIEANDNYIGAWYKGDTLIGKPGDTYKISDDTFLNAKATLSSLICEMNDIELTYDKEQTINLTCNGKITNTNLNTNNFDLENIKINNITSSQISNGIIYKLNIQGLKSGTGKISLKEGTIKDINNLTNNKLEKEYKIKKADNTIKVIPNNLKYNGLEQDLVNKENNLYFSEEVLTKENYQEKGKSTISKKDAGNYKIYYYALGDENHEDKYGYINVKIEKTSPGVVLPQNNIDLAQNSVYEINLLTNTPGKIFIKNEDKNSSIKTMGYKIIMQGLKSGTSKSLITFTPSDQNYKSVTKELIINIKKQAKEEECQDLTYNGQDQYLVKQNETINLENNIGHDPDKYYVKEKAKEGYLFDDNTKEKSLVCEIKKIDSKNSLSPIIIDYNGKKQKLVKSNSNKIYYSLDKPLTSNNYQSGTRQIPEKTNAGTYQIYYYIVGDKYYFDGQGKVISTINKIENPTIIDKNNLTYNGNKQDLLNIKNQYGDIYFSKEKLNKNNYLKGSLDIPKEINALDYKIYYYIPETDNYLEKSGSINAEIKKKDNDLIVKGRNLIYQNNPQKLVNISDSSIDVYYSLDKLDKDNYLKGSTDIPLGLDKGIYNIYYFVKGNNNIKDLSGKVTSNITDKDLYLSSNKGSVNLLNTKTITISNYKNIKVLNDEVNTKIDGNNITFNPSKSGKFNIIFLVDGYELEYDLTVYDNAEIGTCNKLNYTSHVQTLIDNGIGVTYINNRRRKVGEQLVTVNANEGYRFSDGSTSKVITCKIS